MAIRVRCINAVCPSVGAPCTVADTLLMGYGELVICGTCGHPCEFIGAARPPRHHVDPAMLNKATPLRDFRRASPDLMARLIAERYPHTHEG